MTAATRNRPQQPKCRTEIAVSVKDIAMASAAAAAAVTLVLAFLRKISEESDTGSCESSEGFAGCCDGIACEVGEDSCWH